MNLSEANLLPHQMPNSHCPSVQFKGLFFLKGLRPLFRRNLPNKLEQRRKNKTEADKMLQESSRGCRKEKNKKTNQTKNKSENIHFLVRRLLRTQQKTAGGKFPRGSWVVALGSSRWKSREDEGSDLCVMVRVSGWSVGRRRRVGFDPPALHVRDELVWDLG